MGKISVKFPVELKSLSFRRVKASFVLRASIEEFGWLIERERQDKFRKRHRRECWNVDGIDLRSRAID